MKQLQNFIKKQDVNDYSVVYSPFSEIQNPNLEEHEESKEDAQKTFSLDIKRKQISLEAQMQHIQTYARMLYDKCFIGSLCIENLSVTTYQQNSYDWNYVKSGKRYLFRITITSENEVTIFVFLFAKTTDEPLLVAIKIVKSVELSFKFIDGLNDSIINNINSIYYGLLKRIEKSMPRVKEEKRTETKDLIKEINNLYTL